MPIGAFASVEPGDGIRLDGCVASLDGSVIIRDSITESSADPVSIGVALAESLLDRGADNILAAIRDTRPGPE